LLHPKDVLDAAIVKEHMNFPHGFLRNFVGFDGRIMTVGLQRSALVAAVTGLLALSSMPPGRGIAHSQGAASFEIVANIPHQFPVYHTAISPDGRLVASSGGLDRSIKLWDLATGRLIRALRGHNARVQDIAFSPDGSRLLSGSGDKRSDEHSARIWDVASGQLVRAFNHPAYVMAVAFSPDGARVLTGTAGYEGDPGTVRLWEIASGRLLWSARGSAGIGQVMFSPDGSRAAAVFGKSVAVWEARSGRPLQTLRSQSEVLSAAFLRDGNGVLAAYSDGVKLWEGSGRLARTIPMSNPIYARKQASGEAIMAPTFSRDTSQVAFLGDDEKTIRLWDIASGQLVRSFAREVKATRTSAVFSPDGANILLGEEDNSLELWEARSGRLLRSFSDLPIATVASLAFAPDGTRFLSGGGDGSMRVWDAATGQVLRSLYGHFEEEIGSVAFSPNGTRIASTSESSVKLWDALTGETLAVLQENAQNVRFLPGGARVLTLSSEDAAKLWDVPTGELIGSLEGSKTQDWGCVSASADGTRMFAGGSGTANVSRATLWDTQSGRLLKTYLRPAFKGGMRCAPQSPTFSPDGTRLAAADFSSDGSSVVTLWDIASGRRLRTLQGHTDWINAVAFSPDGTRIISAGRDKTVKMWDAASGRLLHSLPGHVSSITSLAFSPDGSRFISASEDATIRIWKGDTGELIAVLLATSDGNWVTITPEGFFDSSEHGAELLNVVRGVEVYSIDQLYQPLHRPDLVREKLAGDPHGLVRMAAAKLDLTKVLGSGSAPLVALTSPSTGTAVREGRIAVAATVIDTGGGVGRIEWRVNGVTLAVEPQGSDSGNDRRPGAAGATVRAVEQSLPLAPGANQITLVAYNARNLVASSSASVSVINEAAPTAPRLHVLAIGVNDYRDSRLHLKFAVPDAKAVGDALRRAGDRLYDRVEVTELLDGNVTIANLGRVIAEISRKVRPQDVFVFFLAGHGLTIDGRYYFFPYDLHYSGESSVLEHGISQDHWQAWFAKIPARKSILLYDTCESGTVTEERVAQRGIVSKTAIDRLTQAIGRAMLTASGGKAPALEGFRGHGVFTYSELDALGRADDNADGLIEITSLANYVDREVPELSFQAFHLRQVPQMKIVGSNFPLARKVAVLPATDEPAVSLIPVQPTHAIVAPVDVFERAEGQEPVEKLTPGTLVRVVRSEQGWVLIAKYGKPLGYVAAGLTATAFAPIH
jgi:WD40 repeat protein